MVGWTAEGGITGAGRAAAWLYTEITKEFDPTTPRAIDRTALQIAIWNALFDGDTTVSATNGGIFYVSDDRHTGVTDLANGYLQRLASADISAADASWIQLNNISTDGRSAQDFIGPLASAQPVPEPSAALLLGMGVLSLAAFRSRKALLRRA
jgi:hypothetical protein